MAGMNETEREQWARALRAKGSACSSGMARGRMGSQGGKGIAPNKAAGSKGGIRRQGSKRG
ncbi:MAG: hypothetical protein IKV48_01270 [Eggerthellaceae bacterium]|nr:hypothetical protein [Eggerthellaceae bacterium]